MPNNPATKPTRIAVGSVRKGHTVRLANRAKTGLSPAYITVTDVVPEDIAEGKPGYKVYTADGQYGPHLPASAKFELMPESAAKAEVTPKQAAKTPKGPRISPSLKAAVGKLITPQGEAGQLVRSDIEADPMVLIAGERRGWFTVDRTGPERKTDLVILTEDGFKAAEAMGLVQAAVERAAGMDEGVADDEGSEGDTEE